MKKHVLVLAMAAVMVAACGKKEEPAPAPAPAPVATAPAPAPAPAGPVLDEEKVLNVYNWPDYITENMLADFEKDHPNIKVDLISPPTEQADQKIQQMLQSGSGVDVLEVRDLTVGPFANNKWLYDMAGDLKGWDGLDKLTDQAKKFTFDAAGHSYFIPYGFYGLSLFYRTDLVKEAGFDGPPATWDDLVTEAAKIQDPTQNRYGYAFRGGSNSAGQLMSILEAYNADNLDAENAYKVKSGATIFSTPE